MSIYVQSRHKNVSVKQQSDFFRYIFCVIPVSSRKCSDLGKPDLVEKKFKKFNTRNKSWKIPFPTILPNREIKVFFSNVRSSRLQMFF